MLTKTEFHYHYQKAVNVIQALQTVTAHEHPNKYDINGIPMVSTSMVNHGTMCVTSNDIRGIL